jgi:hypothetical protein
VRQQNRRLLISDGIVVDLDSIVESPARRGCDRWSKHPSLLPSSSAGELARLLPVTET